MPAWLGAPGAAVVEATWQGVVLAALVAAVGRAAGAGLPRLRHALAAGGVLVLSAGFLASAVRITVAAVSSSVKTIVAVADPALVEPVREVAFVEPAVLQWLGLAWCATVLVAAVRLLGGLAGVGRLMASGEPVTDARVLAAFEDAVRRVGPAGRVELRAVAGLSSPCVAGWRRATVLVPIGFGQGLAGEHMTAILVHELVHVARRDYRAGLLLQIARLPVWFHPCAAWLVRRAADAREEACDDETARLTEPLVYARALERLERWRGSLHTGLIAAAAPTESRILRLVLPTPVRRLRVAIILVVSAVVAAAATARSPERSGTYGRMLAELAAPLVDIRAHDPAGTFTLQLRGGRALGATVDGRRLPRGSVLQHGDRVTLLDGSGVPAVSVQVTDGGRGIQWAARPAR